MPLNTDTEVERMREVFDLVKPSPFWKMPICTTVPKSLASMEEIIDAVIFFAGGEPLVTSRGDEWGVEGEGYYNWIGA